MYSLTEERLGNFPPTVLQSGLSPIGTESYSCYFTSLDRPLGLQEAEATRTLNRRHMKVVRLSAVRTVRLYPQETTLVLISVTRRVG
jgi:hypothetical protein